MKPETAALLEKFHNAKRFQFVESDLGLELEHDLTDEEKAELAKAEYGQTLAGPVDDLFIAIIKKVVKLAGDAAKQQFNDKLTEL